jgi:hypothetical protein
VALDNSAASCQSWKGSWPISAELNRNVDDAAPDLCLGLSNRGKDKIAFQFRELQLSYPIYLLEEIKLVQEYLEEMSRRARVLMITLWLDRKILVCLIQMVKT